MGSGVAIIGRAAFTFNVIVNSVPDYTASHNKNNNEGNALYYSLQAHFALPPPFLLSLVVRGLIRMKNLTHAESPVMSLCARHLIH